MIGDLLTRPGVAHIDDDGNLHVDILQLAIKARAPITPESIAKLSGMVQDFITALDNEAECRLHNHIKKKTSTRTPLTTTFRKRD